MPTIDSFQAPYEKAEQSGGRYLPHTLQVKAVDLELPKMNESKL